MIENIVSFLDTINIQEETAVVDAVTLAYKNFSMVVIVAKKGDVVETSVGVALDKEQHYIQEFPKINGAWHGELGDFSFDVEETENSITAGYSHTDGTTSLKTVSTR
jgi:hypothetical protein